AAPVAIREVAEPVAHRNEAMVRVEAFSINRGELGSLARQPSGWQPGQDVAGTVIAAAQDGSGPAAGTRIVGLVEEFGWAERVPVMTSRLAVRPAQVRMEDAAAMPIPGLTALRALRRGGLLLDKPVMITGATGIVGVLAVQLAARAGARVTAVARQDAAAMLRSLGAEAVVPSPTDAAGPFPLILESSGGDTLAAAMARVAPGGAIVVYGNTSAQPTPFTFAAFRAAQNARIETLYHYSCEPAEQSFGDDLALLVREMAGGHLKMEIAGEQDWSEMAAVVAHMKQSRFRGKYVFRVS
ncbi:MAG: zinc-binding dehydrogenase, partial [Variibacter sp.]|nr:zinc-binding dehydrogenase [Variibacter sp.]